MKITDCVTPARRSASFRSFHADCERKRAKRDGAEYQPAAAPSRAENSKKVRRGRLNGRRKLRRASRLSRFVSFSFAATDRRAYRSRSSPHTTRRRRNNISTRERRTVARCENRSCRDGEVRPERNGTARPGPAYPADGSKRKEAERRSADSRGALSDGTIDIVVEGDNSGRRQR